MSNYPDSLDEQADVMSGTTLAMLTGSVLAIPFVGILPLLTVILGLTVGLSMVRSGAKEDAKRNK